MDESGEHQTDTRTEIETPHILTHRRVMKIENTWTQGGEHYTLGSTGGNRGGTAGWGSWGEIVWGEMPDMGEGEEGSKSHSHVCTLQLSYMFFTCTPKPKMQLKMTLNLNN